MKQPCIDIVIPTHNNVRWVEQTIDSVLEQTHQNFKLYIIDDGSSDGTEELIRSMRDDRLVYVKKKNGGVSSARNLGIKKAHSDYIAFLDSDDLWMPEKLEKQIALMLSNNEIGLVYGHHYIIDEDNIIQGNLRRTVHGHVFDDLVNGNYISGSASMVLIRRSILDKAGAFFREDLVNGEDWELWLRISKLCLVEFVPEIIASIRTHPQGAQQDNKKMADGLVYAYHEMKKEFDLTSTQQRLLASYCLFHAAASYYAVSEKRLARKTMFELFRENPPARFDRIAWKGEYEPGLYSKIIVSLPVVTYLSLPIKLILRFSRYVLHWVLRIVRFTKRIARKSLHVIKDIVGS